LKHSKEVSNHSQKFIPRYVRLTEKFGFSEKEKIALMYILVCNIGRSFPPPPSSVNQIDIRTMIFHVSKYSQMNSTEIMQFLLPSRPHMQQACFILLNFFYLSFPFNFNLSFFLFFPIKK